MAYLDYSDYISMGGSLNESAFNGYRMDAESKLNYLTNNRIQNLNEIPQVVKNLVFKIITILNSIDATNANNGAGVVNSQQITSYSNGIESFGYATGNNSKGSTSIDDTLTSIIKEYLSAYPELLYRGRVQWKQKR